MSDTSKLMDALISLDGSRQWNSTAMAWASNMATLETRGHDASWVGENRDGVIGQSDVPG